MKMPYSSSQAFSPTGAYGTRTSPSSYGFTSPDPHPQHATAPNAYQRSSVNGVNGYGAQQAVWSPSAFGAGYGYAKSTVDPKATYATSKEAYAQMGNEYRFGAQGSQHAQGYSGFPQSPQQQTFGNHHAGYGRGTHSHTTSGNYGYYGAPGQTNAGRGRANGTDYYAGMESGGGYYGGISQSPVAQAYGYAGGAAHTAIRGAHPPQQQVGAATNRGAVGGLVNTGANSAGRGKMWL